MAPRKSRRKAENTEPEIEGNTLKVPAQLSKKAGTTKTRGARSTEPTEPTRGQFNT